MASSPVSFPSSPCSSFLGDSHASPYSDSVVLRGVILPRLSPLPASSSSSLLLVERRGRHLPGLSTAAMASAASSYVEEMCAPRTLYDVLGIAKEATEKEVRSAYRRLALRFHPDAVSEAKQKEANTKAFLEIHSAYLTLSDEGTRSRYDTQMSLQSPSTKGYARGEVRNVTQRSSSVRQAYSPSPSSPVSFSYQSSRGRSWETDQCWC